MRISHVRLDLIDGFERCSIVVCNIDGRRGISLNAGMTMLKSTVPCEPSSVGRSCGVLGDFAERYFRSEGFVMTGKGDRNIIQP